MNPSDISFDDIRNLVIGTVESVSPFEIKILLDLNAPQNTSLNTGEPILFPKINGYVLIPNETGALICIISGMGIEHSSYPKRKGFKDFDLVDLPFPLRKMTVNPLGIIKKDIKNDFRIDRGVYSYPSVGDNVIIPTRNQLETIVENKDKNACIKIGTSPLAANASVYVDPDKLFGRHLAVLGNTGSGKSCSVAGLIRWSINSAKKEFKANENRKLNSRFIILDPNGEYTNTFDNLVTSVKKYKVSLDKSDKAENIRVPAWLWNSKEWIFLSRAAPGLQAPVLLETLSLLKRGSSVEDNINLQCYNFLNGYYSYFKSIFSMPPIKMSKGDKYECKDACKHFIQDIDRFISQLGNAFKEALEENKKTIIEFFIKNSDKTKTYFNGCSETDLLVVLNALQTSIDLFDKTKITSTITADTPIEFPVEQLSAAINTIANSHGGNSPQHASSLILRINSLLEDSRIHDILLGETNNYSLNQWINDYISSDDESITVIDFSLVPNEIINILVSVIARLTFESLQRYRKVNGEVLPTVLVMEEAHNFINKYNSSDELSPENLCSQTFEKIAKEGRKFGLGLVLSSQRPDELSPTVLSQCNTFLLHRIVNDRDQDIVRRLVPDNLGKLLNELPTLPTRKAILLGWATPIPILVEMNELPKSEQPQSDDPDFWDVWTRKVERKINWEEITTEWQKDYSSIIQNKENELTKQDTADDDEIPF